MHCFSPHAEPVTSSTNSNSSLTNPSLATSMSWFYTMCSLGIALECLRVHLSIMNVVFLLQTYCPDRYDGELPRAFLSPPDNCRAVCESDKWTLLKHLTASTAVKIIPLSLSTAQHSKVLYCITFLHPSLLTFWSFFVKMFLHFHVDHQLEDPDNCLLDQSDLDVVKIAEILLV